MGGGGYQWVTGNYYMCPVSQGMLSTIFAEVLEKMVAVLCPIWTTNIIIILIPVIGLVDAWQTYYGKDSTA